MTDDNNNRSKRSSRHFGGDFDRNEVEMDLPKFVDILDENYRLKTELQALKDEKGLNNPWKKWIYFARMTDAWRPLPRLFFGAYIVILYETVMWFMTLDEPNNAQAGLISVLVGAGAAWFNSYVKSKGDGHAE